MQLINYEKHKKSYIIHSGSSGSGKNFFKVKLKCKTTTGMQKQSYVIFTLTLEHHIHAHTRTQSSGRRKLAARQLTAVNWPQGKLATATTDRG